MYHPHTLPICTCAARNRKRLGALVPIVRCRAGNRKQPHAEVDRIIQVPRREGKRQDHCRPSPHHKRSGDTSLWLSRCVVRSYRVRLLRNSGRTERQPDVNQHAQRTR